MFHQTVYRIWILRTSHHIGYRYSTETAHYKKLYQSFQTLQPFLQGLLSPASFRLLRREIFYLCIHYLYYDPDVHQPVTFVDPLMLIRSHSLEMDSNYYDEKYSPEIREGSLLMFPSYFKHSVPKNKTKYTRKSVSMNIVPKGMLGDPHSLTELLFHKVL